MSRTQHNSKGPGDNIVVSDSAWKKRDLNLIFVDEPVTFATGRDLPNLLVQLGVYATCSAARRAAEAAEFHEDTPN